MHCSIQNCEKYLNSKILYKKYNRLLHFLPMLLQAWKKVVLNFITRLPQVGDYDLICVIINELIKQHYYILYANIINFCKIVNLNYFYIYCFHN